MAVLLGASCAGTYEPVPVDLPPISPQARHATIGGVHVSAVSGVSLKELDDFDRLIRLELKRRGIQVEPLSGRPMLRVEVRNLNAESQATVQLRKQLTFWVGGPWSNLTTNDLEVHSRMESDGRIIDRFHTFCETMKDWEALKASVARRVADAVYYAY
jgi:hypothetical protein